MKTKLIAAREPEALNRFMLLFVYLSIILLFQFQQSNAQNNIRQTIIPIQEGLGVDALTGSCVYSRTDISMECKGSLDLNIGFAYNSSCTAIDNGFGPGWFMTYTMKYEQLSPNAISIKRNNGRKDIFSLIGGNYVGPSGVFDSLTEYQMGKYILVDKFGIKYYFDDSTHKSLTKVKDRNNNEITITYTSGLPTSISDPSGRLITFIYTSGHLTQITDANISPSRSIGIIYNANKNPITVTDVLGYQLKYQYDSRYNLTKFTNEDNIDFNISFTDCIHVSDISIPGVNQRTFIMDSLSKTTTMNMQVGSNLQSTSYKFDSIGNLIETIGNCCGYHTNYEYDVDRNVTKKIDAMGYPTNYVYNSKGKLLEEIDFHGDKIVNTYNNYGDITSIKDKKNNITNLIYNAQGNLTAINKPLGVSESFTYNASGEIISYTNPNGFTTSYTRNNNGYITQVNLPGGVVNSFSVNNIGFITSKNDGMGFTTTYINNKKGWTTQMTEPSNTVTSKSYNGRGLTTSITNALGQTTSYTYNQLGKVLAETSPTGTINMTYDQAGNQISLTDKKGYVTNKNYNALNQLTSEVNALGQTHSIIYNPIGNINSETEFNGITTTNIYDSLHRTIGILDPISSLINGDYIKIEYDKNGNKTKVTDQMGNATNYTYDALNRQISEQKPIGSTTMSYDAVGNVTTITNALGHSITRVYDNKNRLITETDPLFHSTSYTYNNNDNVLTITNKNGQTQTFSYNQLNQKVGETNALGEPTTFSVNKLGYIMSTFLPTGRTITNIYDSGNRLISSSDNMGLLFSKTYDANDNVVTEYDGNNLQTTFTYNSLNQILTVTDPQMHTSSNSYNVFSFLVASTDRNGNTASYTYDALGRIISTTLPSGDIITQSYDRNGNIISRKDDNNNTTTYFYDVNNRLLNETFANGTSNTYSYDLANRNISKTNQKGLTTYFTYDAAGRLLTRNYPGTNDDNFTYTNEGKILNASNSNATILFSYDNDQKLLSESNNGKVTSYQYQITGGNRYRQINYPGGRIIRENYDQRMNLQQIKEGSTTLVSKSYDNGERLTGMTFSNGTAASYTYNVNNSIASITHTRVSPLTLIAQFNYTRDSETNILTAQKIHRSTNSEKYTYNANQQLINYKEGTLSGGNITAPLTQSQFNLDGVQNRTSVIKDGATTNYTINAVNQYTAINGGSIINPTYDLNGNTLTDGNLSYSYSDNDQLLAVNGGALATYQNDALGRRTKKIAGATTVLYYYDGHNVIEERNASNAVQATYVYGTKDDEILSMTRGSSTYYYHTNALGSVVAISNASGNTVERYEYTAFGKPSFFNSSYGTLSNSSIGNPYLFTSREYDAESGNYFYRARYYNPNFGSFLQTDPIGNWGDGGNLGNAYCYVGNNTINRTDPSGNWWVGWKSHRKKQNADGSFEERDVWFGFGSDRGELSMVPQGTGSTPVGRKGGEISATINVNTNTEDPLDKAKRDRPIPSISSITDGGCMEPWLNTGKLGGRYITNANGQKKATMPNNCGIYISGEGEDYHATLVNPFDEYPLGDFPPMPKDQCVVADSDGKGCTEHGNNPWKPMLHIRMLTAEREETERPRLTSRGVIKAKRQQQ